MDYFRYLRDQSHAIKNQLELLLEKYKVQPVGHGYIDLIVGKELVEEFINELTNHNIIIMGVTWWCHCTTKSDSLLGCPHGMEGQEVDIIIKDGLVKLKRQCQDYPFYG